MADERPELLIPLAVVGLVLMVAAVVVLVTVVRSDDHTDDLGAETNTTQATTNYGCPVSKTGIGDTTYSDPICNEMGFVADQCAEIEPSPIDPNTIYNDPSGTGGQQGVLTYRAYRDDYGKLAVVTWYFEQHTIQLGCGEVTRNYTIQQYQDLVGQ